MGERVRVGDLGGRASWRRRNSDARSAEARALRLRRVQGGAEWIDELVHPDLDAIDAFVSGYEFARGQPFTGHERSVVGAAQISLLAYTPRCEHSDRELGVVAGPDRPFTDQLRAVATR